MDFFTHQGKKAVLITTEDIQSADSSMSSKMANVHWTKKISEILEHGNFHLYLHK